MDQVELKRAALHEAGHAVAALLSGVRVVHATIDSTEIGVAHVLTTLVHAPSSWPMPMRVPFLYSNIAVMLAGPLGEALWVNAMSWRRAFALANKAIFTAALHDEGTDFRQALELAREFGLPPGNAEEGLNLVARQLAKAMNLASIRRAGSRVADALMREGKLDEAKLADLVYAERVADSAFLASPTALRKLIDRECGAYAVPRLEVAR